MSRRVWIAQCLCPGRHAIMAAGGEARSAGEAEAKVRQPLREQVTVLLREKAINPWCAMCGAQAETWVFEVGRTKFATMAEAQPELTNTAAENELARALYGDLHRQGKPN